MHVSGVTILNMQDTVPIIMLGKFISLHLTRLIFSLIVTLATELRGRIQSLRGLVKQTEGKNLEQM